MMGLGDRVVKYVDTPYLRLLCFMVGDGCRLLT